MNYAFLPFAKSLFAGLFVALLGLSTAAYAADEKKPEAVKVDAAKGEALYASGDAGRNITACVACHGAAGNSTIAQNPKLAAQPAAYLHKQLADFKSPNRPNPVMTAMAQPLNDADMQNIAAYLFAQTAAPGAAKDKDTVLLGKTIYRGGIAAKHVPACASCHGATGNGIPAQYPRLAGQHQDYTLAQLTNFRNGTRKNSVQMTDIAQRLSDEEMKAVADYVAGLK
jgi:cytochrome c553